MKTAVNEDNTINAPLKAELFPETLSFQDFAEQLFGPTSKELVTEVRGTELRILTYICGKTNHILDLLGLPSLYWFSFQCSLDKKQLSSLNFLFS